VTELVIALESDSILCKKQSCRVRFLFKFGACICNGVVSNSTVDSFKMAASSVGGSLALTSYDLRVMLVLNVRSGGFCSFGFLV